MKKVLYSTILLLLIIILVIVALNLPIKATHEVGKVNKETSELSNIVIASSENENTHLQNNGNLRLKKVNGRYVNIENSQEVYYKQDIEKINSNRGVIKNNQVMISS